LSFTLRGNDVHLPTLTSSATYSRISERAVVAPDLAGLFRHAAIGREFFLHDRYDKSIDVAHEFLRWSLGALLQDQDE
jgi:hypothetical protein